MTIRRGHVRPTAVAGTFYPAGAEGLRTTIEEAMDDARRRSDGDRTDPAPAALVVPHAGYAYSGAVAASAYLRIARDASTIRRVVLLGPAHRVPLDGLGLSSATAWESPLGSIALDTDAAVMLAGLPAVRFDDRAHAPEHSLEVQVPFLQTVLEDFRLLPIVVGDASAAEIERVLDAVWTGPETLVVVSTDLSHYHPYEIAAERDARTVAAIAARRPHDVGDTDACGARPLRGLLTAAVSRDLTVTPIDIRNSGDTAGDRRRVVGYGAFTVH